MKKLLLIPAFCILFIACTKKGTPSPTTKIVGKWITTADTLRVYFNGKLEETQPFTEALYQLDDYQFNSDGTVIITNHSDPNIKMTATYIIQGNDMTFNHPTQVVMELQLPPIRKT
jgi:hypothetical protein